MVKAAKSVGLFLLIVALAWGLGLGAATRRKPSHPRQTIFPEIGIAQAPAGLESEAASTMAKLYEGPGYDQCRFVTPLANGGYFFTGVTKSYGSGGYDCWYAKLEANGNMVWQRVYGTEKDDRTVGRGTLLPDGGFLVTGYFYPDGVFLEWLLRLDSSGNAVWKKSYPGIRLVQTKFLSASGEFLVWATVAAQGSSDDDMLVMKLSATGDIIWQKLFKSPYSDWGWAYATSDGGSLLIGSSWDEGAETDTPWLIKLDSSFNIQWQKLYPGLTYIEDAIQLPSGAYIAVGEAEDQWGWYDAVVMKLNASGDIAWQKSYGGQGDEWCWYVDRLESGDLVLSAGTDSFGVGGYDVWLLKLDPDGNSIRQGTFGGPGYDDGYVWPGSGGGTLMLWPDPEFDLFWLVGLDLSGNIQWQKSYGEPDEGEIYSAMPLAGGGYILSGYTTSFSTSDRDAWFWKLDSRGELGGPCDYIQDPIVARIETSIDPGSPGISTQPGFFTVETSAYAAAGFELVQKDSNAVASEFCEGTECAVTCTATAGPASGAAPLAVSFAASASTSGCTGTVAYLWSFGDGQTSSSKNASHTYTSQGTYEWRFEASSDGIACVQGGTITVTGGCTYSLNRTGRTFTNKAGYTKVKATASSEACLSPQLDVSEPWVAATLLNWNNGKGFVKVGAMANIATYQRTAVVTIGGTPFAVVQAGAPCKVISLNPTKSTFSAGGGTGTIGVTATVGECSWTASANGAAASWITITAGAGSGPGEAIYSVSPNTTGKKRTGTISISGGTGTKNHQVSQGK